MCILCHVYILAYIKLYFFNSDYIVTFVVYTNKMLKDKKYKKFMHCIGIDYSVGRKGIVWYCITLRNFKKCFETKCVKVHWSRHFIQT